MEFVPAIMIKILQSPLSKHYGDDFLNINRDALVKILAPLAKIIGKKHAPELVQIYLSEMSAVAAQYIAQLDPAMIDIFTPLTMNMEEAVPLTPELYWRYPQQLEIISSLAHSYPWRMFPFVFFDPRSENSVDVCIDALEKKGFLGVKMYPALGYHPDPSVVETEGIAGKGKFKIGRAYFPNGTPNHAAAERLRSFYEYCANNEIPITTHTSVGGAYSARLYNLDEVMRWSLTAPENWLNVLSQYKLKINFAHMGGNYINPDDDKKRTCSIKWRKAILAYMIDPDLKATVYTDVSYHDMALSRDMGVVSRYFNDLRAVMSRPEQHGGVLYGSDASMITHTWFESEFMAPFADPNNLPPALQDKLFTETPLSFLFRQSNGAYFIPQRYTDFLQARNPNALANLPPYVKKVGQNWVITI
ncbi:MAG: amidohydrolase family protein [bacterium]